MILIAFLGFLAICLILIIITLVSLTRLGDERKKFIKMKAQSYTFIVIIGYLIIEIGENIYKTIWGNGSYAQISPFSLLVTISGVYLISLFFSKKKYGG